MAEGKKGPWFVQFEGSQFGPLSLDEVWLVQKSGKLHGTIFGWCAGMPKWLPVSQIPELQELIHKKDNRRKAERVPFLAAVSITVIGERSEKVVGICRDISTSGISVLCPLVSAGAGSTVEVDIMPTTEGMGGTLRLNGKIARVLPGECGLAVHFDKLTLEQGKRIVQFVDSSKG